MKNRWKIGFMGTPKFAIPILEALNKSEDQISVVITQPDKPAGRGKRLTPPPVKVWAQRHNLPLWQPSKIKEEKFLAKLRDLSLDVIVVAAYGKILPKEVLNIPRLGCINVHASLLPKYRGAAPINWAIIKGEKETGITIMQMDEGMDTGDILLQEAIPIYPEETAGELHDRLSFLGAKLIVKTLKLLKTGDLMPKKQSEEGVSYAPPLKKQDGLLDFLRPAQDLERLIRGLDPWPTAFAFFRKKLIKLFKPEVKKKSQAFSSEPGELVKITPKGLYIATGQDLLMIKEVQIEGKKRMPVEEFIKGWQPKVGEKFQGR